jgi:hypothetical protein
MHGATIKKKHSAYVLPALRQKKFHTHTKQKDSYTYKHFYMACGRTKSRFHLLSLSVHLQPQDC